MTGVSTVPPGFIAFILGAGALGSLYYWGRKLQQLRLIQGTPVSRCRAAAQGYVALSGTQSTVPDHPRVGPMTGQPCTWWSYTVEELRGDDKHKKWVTISQATCSLPFIIDDGTARVMIVPEGAKVTFSSMDRWRGYSEWPTKTSVMNSMDGDYRYTEMRMSEGDSLYAIGQFGSHSVHEVPKGTDDAVSTILTSWKNDHAALLARFDADNNGQIDMEEWDNAREAARKQAMLGADAPDVMRPEPILSCPKDGRPFLLSTKPVEDIAAALLKQVRYGLMIFAACTAGALWLASR